MTNNYITIGALNKYLKNNPNTLYILFFFDKFIGIIKNTQIVRNTIENNLCEEKANNVRNDINIGIPIYKSVISTYLPSVFLILFIVIYI